MVGALCPHLSLLLRILFMPRVVFRAEFFDNNRRYRTGIEYDIDDSVVLPTRDIEIIEEAEPVKRRKSSSMQE
jgi:hypothetical protein